MMNMIIPKIQRFRGIRKLHTIISQETIKPSSPTPSHLKTHNLSLTDYLSPNIHIPSIFFYRNYNNSDINILKKSLSQCLTQYYPFAGRLLTPSAPHINCNDEGVEFVEASIDTRLDDFIHKKEHDETLDQLIPNALGCDANMTSPHMVAVQLSHFTCGGAAVTVTTSHKVADGFTMANFANHWATHTRGGSGSSILPTFFSSSISNSKIPEVPLVEAVAPKDKYATRRFMFPNSKLNDLKNKINTMGRSPVNPSRVESLTSLLFKCAVGATIAKAGSLQPSSLNQMVNLRGRTNANFPKLASGNLFAVAIAKFKDSGDRMELNEVITHLRRKMMELEEIKDVEEVGKNMIEGWVTVLDDEIQAYSFSSVCRFPFYQVDFGWGKPVRVMLGIESVGARLVVLMDTPYGDGIEATVRLEDEEMSIFREDKELHSYAQDI